VRIDGDNLEVALADLPNLRQTLGHRWIAREQAIPPVDSTFPLARTLRIEELRPLVTALDRRLGALTSIPGSKDWRRRIRNNGQEFRETLTEISFAALLRDRGYTFEHPEKGPDLDFAVSLSDGTVLQIEATTPRIVAWADDLVGRLWFLSRRYECSVRVEPLTDRSPILDEKIREATMLSMIKESRERLTLSRRTVPIQIERRDIGLKIILNPDEQPSYSGYNSPNSSPIRAFNYIVGAAEDKAGQLRKARAHSLVIGTNMLPFPEWAQYVTSLRNRVPFYGQFDWGQIPDQVKYIVLFLASYGESRAPAIDVLVRPSDESRMPEALRRFFGRLESSWRGLPPSAG
jgi:hypothetical protein